MALIGLNVAWAVVQVVLLVLRGQLNPIRNVSLLPGSNGWVTPAVMSDSHERPPASEKIRFYLWTRKNPVLARELFVDDAQTLRASKFSSLNPTKILIHGFSQTVSAEFVVATRNAYLVAGDVNVIAVDWSHLARAPFYILAATSTELVGKFWTAQFIDFLVNQGASLSDIHLLGYSLGAHAAGWAGSSLTTGKLPRITGFDPAFPGFEVTGERRRLSRDDADFVDVIHSNGRNKFNKAFGIYDPLGHADFYPNGGSSQPGCISWFAFHRKSCSHRRSIQFYVESILRKGSFLAAPCTSHVDLQLRKCGDCKAFNCVHMGEHVTRSARGSYYLTTRSSRPYSKN